jgi:hypothetical protein
MARRRNARGLLSYGVVKHMRQSMLDFTLESLLEPRPATDAAQDRRE